MFCVPMLLPRFIGAAPMFCVPMLLPRFIGAAPMFCVPVLLPRFMGAAPMFCVPMLLPRFIGAAPMFCVPVLLPRFIGAAPMFWPVWMGRTLMAFSPRFAGAAPMLPRFAGAAPMLPRFAGAVPCPVPCPPAGIWRGGIIGCLLSIPLAPLSRMANDHIWLRYIIWFRRAFGVCAGFLPQEPSAALIRRALPVTSTLPGPGLAIVSGPAAIRFAPVRVSVPH